jgi:hypothetical protein
MLHYDTTITRASWVLDFPYFAELLFHALG